jgi:two-component system sensor histidine kinase HydH
VKNALRTSSLIAALLGWVLLSALNLFVVWALRDRARLLRDNDNERILNTLFSEMRDYNNFASAIESNSILKDRIIGAAIYENNLNAVDRWGKAPQLFDETILRDSSPNRFGRITIPDRQGRSAKFVLHLMRQSPSPPPASPPSARERAENQRETRRQNENRQGAEAPRSIFFSTFMGGRYFYTDISHPDYWRTQTVTGILFPLIEIALLILVLYIRRLYLRNREYREKIEAQHNLVVLGTAAGTLAHEIKNPLLSIRLQTGILQKICGENGNDEVTIINQEVDRLSSLVYRVNDYLREPGGEKAPFNISALLAETSKRVCGVNVLLPGGGADGDGADSAASALVFADENRIRSVLENIFRNAMESGSPRAEIGASVTVHEREVKICVFDRGRGIAEKDLKRVFDPFFTSKSTGTGIGLAISKRFTEAAGGTIGVENRNEREGGGLLVTLTFPRYSEDET